MKYAPIVLFAYNRLEHLHSAVKLLQKNDFAMETELFIYSDGAKDKQIDQERVASVRDYLKTISGFLNVSIVESDRNQGLAQSIIRGVTEIVNRYGTVIVLEDDLETSPDFLRFMNEALDKYKDKPEVMQISGHMFDNVKIKTDKDAVFLPFTTSWGWAVWKRAWNQFDASMSGYDSIKDNEKLRHQFNLDGAYDYFSMLESQRNGKIDSWAIRWYLSFFLKRGIALFPVQSMVRNIGFDGSGTHCKKSDTAKKIHIFNVFGKKEILFPKAIVDKQAYCNVRRGLSLGRSGKGRIVFFWKHGVVKILRYLGYDQKSV